MPSSYDAEEDAASAPDVISPVHAPRNDHAAVQTCLNFMTGPRQRAGLALSAGSEPTKGEGQQRGRRQVDIVRHALDAVAVAGRAPLWRMSANYTGAARTSPGPSWRPDQKRL